MYIAKLTYREQFEDSDFMVENCKIRREISLAD